MAGIFDRDITLLARSLDLRAQRNTLLASNVANIETPGFKAQDLVFEDALDEALHANRPGPLATDNPRHIQPVMPPPLQQVRGQVILSANPVGSRDGNSVDLEKEMAKLAENQVAYQALVQMISSKFQQLRTAIREGEV
ncbi:MAG TPA: flagellar basal body rod protein FlgB [bacterium]|nr:flagellar basal body rod protein FlgB [bacterium]